MTEEYSKKELLQTLIILVWSIAFIGSAVYLGWKLMESNLGDGILYAFVIATILFMTLPVFKR